MNIYESAEDYLETMLMLREEHGFIRSLDIANHLGVTKPSVSYAVKKLKENGYINVDENKLITLAKSGLEIAERIYDRHKKLTKFFTLLGVDEKIAREDACKIEHDISEDSFNAICKMSEKMATEK